MIDFNLIDDAKVNPRELYQYRTFQSKQGCKDQEWIQLSTTPDQGTNSQLDTTNESQEVSPFPAGDHKAHINRLAQRHSKHKTEKT